MLNRKCCFYPHLTVSTLITTAVFSHPKVWKGPGESLVVGVVGLHLPEPSDHAAPLDLALSHPPSLAGGLCNRGFPTVLAPLASP